MSDSRIVTFRGRMVPWITPWSDALNLPEPVVLASGGRGIAYADESVHDRTDDGVLLARGRGPRIPGPGSRPLYEVVDTRRQRRAAGRLVCQICGHRPPPHPDGQVWLLGGADEVADGILTVTPPVCATPCAAFAIRQCPALARGHRTVRVRYPRLWGYHGVLLPARPRASWRAAGPDDDRRTAAVRRPVAAVAARGPHGHPPHRPDDRRPHHRTLRGWGRVVMTTAFQPVSSARFYHAALGDAPEARDGYAGDEALVAKLMANGVPAREMARALRAFQIRAVTHLARTMGIAQFVEIGPGLPPRSTPATHDIALRYHRRRARVLYVDRDPEVVAHLNIAADNNVRGCAKTVLGDLVRPDEIIAEVNVHLDPGQPVALVLTGVLDHVADDGRPRAAVRRLLDDLVPGSALVLTHITHEHDPELIHRAARLLGDAGLTAHLRSFESVAAFFTGLTAIGPGLVPVSQWEPDGTDDGAPHTAHTYGGVGLL
uniref:S-adenosyl methyltransferase n=1 Tax=Streptomyces sp. ML694-90F3 TaxID=1265536 RepID=A0A077KT23_9ACTN|nr:hypothetical protein [Streptomyces sp. ML694-90F3]